MALIISDDGGTIIIAPPQSPIYGTPPAQQPAPPSGAPSPAPTLQPAPSAPPAPSSPVNRNGETLEQAEAAAREMIRGGATAAEALAAHPLPPGTSTQQALDFLSSLPASAKPPMLLSGGLAPEGTVVFTDDDSLDVDPDFEAGDKPTDDDYMQFEIAALDYESGGRQLQSAGANRPGQIIGYPYQGTHNPANLPSGARNWQSENAIDIWLYPGTPVIAVKDGIVSTKYGYGLMDSGGGRFAGSRLHVEHAGGMVSFYTHLHELVAKRGSKVNKGDLLGYSGIANGVPHLHFAVNPPFSPLAFSTSCFRLKGRKPVATITAGGVTVPVVLPPVTTDYPDTVDKAWQGFLNIIGHSLPATAKRIDQNRSKLNALL